MLTQFSRTELLFGKEAMDKFILIIAPFISGVNFVSTFGMILLNLNLLFVVCISVLSNTLGAMNML